MDRVPQAEWGLDELSARTERRSLLQEFGVIESAKDKKKKDKKDKKDKGTQRGLDDEADDEFGGSLMMLESVHWGGTGGTTGIDMDQQEALLTRLFKPHKVGHGTTRACTRNDQPA